MTFRRAAPPWRSKPLARRRDSVVYALRLNVDVAGIAWAELTQRYSDRLSLFLVIKEFLARVVGGPTAAGVPAGDGCVEF